MLSQSFPIREWCCLSPLEPRYCAATVVFPFDIAEGLRLLKTNGDNKDCDNESKLPTPKFGERLGESVDVGGLTSNISGVMRVESSELDGGGIAMGTDIRDGPNDTCLSSLWCRSCKM